MLSIMPYDTSEEAIDIANDTVYGLAAYVSRQDIEHARKVARRMRAGQRLHQLSRLGRRAPFGGYKQSGNGREYGEYGLDDFLEIKGIVGYEAA